MLIVQWDYAHRIIYRQYSVCPGLSCFSRDIELPRYGEHFLLKRSYYYTRVHVNVELGKVAMKHISHYIPKAGWRKNFEICNANIVAESIF